MIENKIIKISMFKLTNFCYFFGGLQKLISNNQHLFLV